MFSKICSRRLNFKKHNCFEFKNVFKRLIKTCLEFVNINLDDCRSSSKDFKYKQTYLSHIVFCCALCTSTVLSNIYRMFIMFYIYKCRFSRIQIWVRERPLESSKNTSKFVIPNHVTNFNQSLCIISPWVPSYSTLKLCY